MTLNERFHAFLKESNNEVQHAFDKMAREIFDKYCLNANGTPYYFTEIEFYYHAPDHKDEFCKKHPKQKKTDTLFFHYSGVDITFGGSENEYGGILIRAITDGKTEMNGPLVSLCALLNGGSDTVSLKIEQCSRPSAGKAICRAPRVGLEIKGKYLTEKKIHQNKPYRYYIQGANVKNRPKFEDIIENK